MAEWFLFLPQVRLPVADIVERVRHAESSGFDGVAFIDHLEAPGLPDESIWEAMGIATWVAVKTQRLRIGHLVLCDAFRHPAVLAKQAVTLSAASDGRFELGLGSGSWPAEFTRFDIGQQDPVARVEQLERHLTLLARYWGHRLPQLAPAAGSARLSVQQMVGFVRRGSDPHAVRELSTRRFGYLGAGLVCGNADELRRHFAELAGQGVERFYVWFAHFASPDSLHEFGETVIATFPVTAAR